VARRKGWDELSEGYRSRLVKGGVSKTDYESGASLKSARGHKTPTGIGEKSYQQLRRLASGFDWDDQKPKEVIDEALGRGETPEWIKSRLAERRTDTREYRARHNKEPGKKHWDRRRMTVPRAWYWYH